MAETALSPREEAYRILMVTRREPDAFAEEFAQLKEKDFKGRHDLNLAIYLVSGTIKLQKRLDLILSRFLRKKLTTHSDSLLAVLRLGCFQLLPECNMPHYAAVNETVNLAKKHTPGAESLVNAVLKNISKEMDSLTFEELRSDSLNFLSQYHSHPIWFVRELLTYWLDSVVEKLLKTGNDPQPLVLRAMREPEALKDYLGSLQRHNIRFKQGRFLKNFVNILSDVNPTQLPGFADGSYVLQNEAAGLIVDLLDPQPEQSILDLCAAPGGKTSDIVERVGDRAKVTAVDVSAERLNLLRENLERLDLKSVLVIQADGRKFQSGIYDRILVDAPCSGSGVFRKFPESRWITTPEDVGRLAQQQVQLLENAANLLAPTGRMVYSTCSVLKAENENVIERFLSEHPKFEVILPEEFPHVNVVGEDLMVRTFPGLKYLDNVFAACLVRKQPAEE
ncbi:MAG: 16S rRNA (cytosine(967)-C(5))-methyltransferase RsmB [candidate division Zixibacteria bacterium]|nr:16S rRNA (cytosine(967)-C(5))-methyltransferase RsmB [candidate division Zixibacteria bacterium]